MQISLVGQGFLIIEACRSHSEVLLSVALLCTSGQPDAWTKHQVYLNKR